MNLTEMLEIFETSTDTQRMDFAYSKNRKVSIYRVGVIIRIDITKRTEPYSEPKTSPQLVTLEGLEIET